MAWSIDQATGQVETVADSERWRASMPTRAGRDESMASTNTNHPASSRPRIPSRDKLGRTELRDAVRRPGHPACRCEMDALCYERGIEFDPAAVPLELAEVAYGIVDQPVWEGHSLAQEFYERRAAERQQRRKVPEWFSVQDLLREPWEREAVEAA
jgi:hypothetical protein